MAADVVASIVDTLLEGGGNAPKVEEENIPIPLTEPSVQENRTKAPKLGDTPTTYSTDEEPHTILDAVTRQPM